MTPTLLSGEKIKRIYNSSIIPGTFEVTSLIQELDQYDKIQVGTMKLVHQHLVKIDETLFGITIFSTQVLAEFQNQSDTTYQSWVLAFHPEYECIYIKGCPKYTSDMIHPYNIGILDMQIQAIKNTDSVLLKYPPNILVQSAKFPNMVVVS